MDYFTFTRPKRPAGLQRQSDHRPEPQACTSGRKSASEVIPWLASKVSSKASTLGLGQLRGASFGPANFGSHSWSRSGPRKGASSEKAAPVSMAQEAFPHANEAVS